MSKYRFKARNDKGELIEGEQDSPSEAAVTEDLVRKGLVPVEVRGKLLEVNLSKPRLFKPRVKLRDLSVFFKQLGAIFSAGVPLMETLAAVGEQITDKNLKAVVDAVKLDIESGNSFSQALARHPEVFSHLIVTMVEAGEKGGVLGEVLARISAYMEKEGELNAKIKAALRYPILVLAVLGIGFMVAVTMIIPRFSSTFSSFGTDLPLPTRILLGINHAVTNYWWLTAAVAGLAFFLFRSWIRSPAGQRQWDKLMLVLPVMGMLNIKLALSRFFRMLSSMLHSGIPLVYALQVTASTADNVILSGIIKQVEEDITVGSSLSNAMKRFSFFPSTAVHMAAIGEKSGNLSEMLTKSASYFDEETDYVVSNLLVLIEPFLIFFLAMLVTLLALGIFLPIWDLNSAVVT